MVDRHRAQYVVAGVAAVQVVPFVRAASSSSSGRTSSNSFPMFTTPGEMAPAAECPEVTEDTQTWIVQVGR